MGLAWGGGGEKVAIRRQIKAVKHDQQGIRRPGEHGTLRQSTDTSTYYPSPNLDRVPMAIPQDHLKLPVESVMLHTYFP